MDPNPAPGNPGPRPLGRTGRRRGRSLVGIAALVALAVGACGGDSDPVDVEFTDPADLTYAPELGVDLSAMVKSSSGLYWKDVVVGTGERVGVGDLVVVEYSGWLPDGTLFDTTRTPGRTPFIFQVGIGSVIAGWDEGVQEMLVGGVRQLVVPPQLAYGTRSVGRIPAGSTLVFEVEVIDRN